MENIERGRDDCEVKMSVLMIEDDDFLRKLFRDKFIKEGFDFIEATNTVEGMSKAQAERPDLVVLDLLLPRSSGFQFLQEIKIKEELKEIPVVILSVLSQEEDREEAMKLGAVDYFVKMDINLSKFIEAIRGILKKSKNL